MRKVLRDRVLGSLGRARLWRLPRNRMDQPSVIFLCFLGTSYLLLYILDLKCPNLRQKIKMSSASESEMSFDSDDSDINFVPEVEIENAWQRAAVREKTNFSSDEDNLFADEPRSDCRIPGRSWTQITWSCDPAVAQKSYAIKLMERVVPQWVKLLLPQCRGRWIINFQWVKRLLPRCRSAVVVE